MGAKLGWHLITLFPFHPSFYGLLPFPQDAIDNGPKPKEHSQMNDKKPWDTQPLIRCENEQCRELCTEFELKNSNGKCPYCGQPIRTKEESS